MAVLERLSDEEAYLWAILSDRSGLDLAEFCWVDGSADDGCFRAWPFQWAWWRDEAPLQIDQCARSVGKSLGIKVRSFAFPFNFPGQELVITAPEGIHVDAITDLIETQFLNTRLGREMLSGKSGVKHKPFHMNFCNGARIMGRIPHRDGSGVKGTHPVQLELDEAQDYPKPGWTELTETLKRGTDNATWHIHGVSRGVRDKFYDFTQEDPANEFRVHHYYAMHRPNWTDEERQQKIREYGSREDPDYRRNVLGSHGDATNPLFVLHRLMKCVDSDASSPYNTNDYYKVEIKDSELEHMGVDVISVLNFPQGHKKYDVVWMGMDVGFTTDPSEILVFAEYHPSAKELAADQRAKRAVPAEGLSRAKCIARISMRRLSHPQQVQAILWILDFYKPRGFSMDKTGNGLPLFQDVQDRVIQACAALPPKEARRRLDVVKGYNFAEKVLVDFDRAIDVKDPLDADEMADEAGIKRNVLEYCVDEETEALTEAGWTKECDLRVGQQILTLNTVSGQGEWQEVQEVHRFHGERQVVEMNSRSFSSVTTLDHRWFVRYYDPYSRTNRERWRTTRELKPPDRIPRARPLSSYPDGFYGDAFVELVAWVWTEGCFAWGRRDWCGLTIGQSMKVNSPNCDRIRINLKRLLGAPAKAAHGGSWYESNRKGVAEFHLTAGAARAFVDVMDPTTKAVHPAFLCRLSKDQLELFLEVSFLADGSRFGKRLQLAQSNEDRIRSFEMACALAGIPTSTTHDAAGRWVCSVLERQWTSPQQGKGLGTATRVERLHTGTVWCPQTQNGTFLARRRGSVYFTGNSTDKLREFVDNGRLLLPLDTDLIAEFQGQTYTYSKVGMDSYGRRRRLFSEGKFHALDAARMAIMGLVQNPIETFAKKEMDRRPVMDVFIAM